MTGDDLLEPARRQLYRLPPDSFTAARADLARSTADPELSKAIGGLRKPTVAAWIVNAHVAADPHVVDRLTDLHDRLRQAHGEAGAPGLRDLSLERRRTVAEIADAAVTGSGRDVVSQTVRDEVMSTFDAAVADPDIARRLGALQRSQSWSGFGVATVGGPSLRLVGNGSSRSGPADGKESAQARNEAHAGGPAEGPGTTSELEAARAQAQQRLAEAETELSGAESAEQELTQRVRKLSTRLATLQHELDRARRELTEAKHATTTARRARRTARSALDGVERHR